MVPFGVVPLPRVVLFFKDGWGEGVQLIMAALASTVGFRRVRRRFRNVRVFFRMGEIARRLFRRSFQVCVRAINDAVRKVRVLRVLYFVRKVLVLCVVDVHLANLYHGVRFEVRAFRFRASNDRKGGDANLMYKTYVRVHAIARRLQMAIGRPICRFPVLLHSLQDRFSVAPFYLLNREDRRLRRALSVEDRRSLLIYFGGR